VAIPYIQLGRVELDPMGVPVAASMQPQQAEPFEQLLRDSIADEADARADAAEEAPAEAADDPHADLDPDDADRDLQPRETRAAADEDADAELQDPAGEAALEEHADVTDGLRRTEPEPSERGSERRDSASSRSAAPAHEPLVTAAFHAQHKTQQQLTTAGTTTQRPGAAAARGGEPMVRGAGGAPLQSGVAAKSARVQTGYATKSAQSMQLLEQARDSVFKQILMKLTDGGGEMRMRLSPPDLGQLDLRMTVEGGNRLSLVIGAERSDLAHLLQRHIEELKGTLQENGLEVTGAEVQTREDFERQHQASDDAAGRGPAGDADDITEDAASAPQTRGYITADGLDFWA